jgi:heavy-metal resistance protein
MKSGIKSVGAIVGLALVLGAVPPRAGAQQAGGGAPLDAKGAEETLEALLIVSLKRDMGLETAQAVELADKVKPLLEARREFAKQQARLRRELSDALKSPVPDKDHIDRLIASVFELRASFAASQQKTFTELSANMDTIQRGKLFVAMEMFEERVRRHLRRLQEGGPRRNRGAAARDAQNGDDL